MAKQNKTFYDERLAMGKPFTSPPVPQTSSTPENEIEKVYLNEHDFVTTPWGTEYATENGRLKLLVKINEIIDRLNSL